MAKNTKIFKTYSDPGHGWIAVKISLLERLGIADKITPFSYMRGKTAYLEEDCDATRFVMAYKETFGVLPQYTQNKHTNGQERIRYYARYTRT